MAAEDVRGTLAKAGLKAAGFNLPVEFRGDAARFEDGLAKLRGYAEYAESIGAKRCITWIVPFSDALSYEENFKIHRDRLRKCCEVLGEHGILLGLEFVGPPKLRKGKKYSFVHNLDQALELCEAIGTENAGLLLDSFHWDLAGQVKEDFGKVSPDKVALVHINDAVAGLRADEQEDLVRRLPGETGVLRIGEFLGGLASIGYDGPVFVEPFEPKLSKMTFDEALKAVMDSMVKVWPK